MLARGILAEGLPVGVLAGGVLAVWGEQDGSNSNFDAMALMGLQLCFYLLTAGDQDFNASRSSSAVEPLLLTPSLFQHTGRQFEILK